MNRASSVFIYRPMILSGDRSKRKERCLLQHSITKFFHFNVENLGKHLCHRIIMLCWVILPQEVWRNVSKPSCWRCIIIYQGWVNRKIMLRQILNLFGIFTIYWSLGIITSFVNSKLNYALIRLRCFTLTFSKCKNWKCKDQKCKFFLLSF